MLRKTAELRSDLGAQVAAQRSTSTIQQAVKASIDEVRRSDSTMSKFAIRRYKTTDESALIDLWRECGLVVPWNNPGADIQRKLADSAEQLYVGLLDRELIASCMSGYDGHRGWIYYLAVKKARRSQGFATRLVAHAEAELSAIGCPKINLMVRNSNDKTIAFYQRNGYTPDSVVVLSKRLIEDLPQE